MIRNPVIELNTNSKREINSIFFTENDAADAPNICAYNPFVKYANGADATDDAAISSNLRKQIHLDVSTLTLH